jgi:hypothetical protein
MTHAFCVGNIGEAQNWQRCINRLLGLTAAGRLGTIKAILIQRGVEVGPPIPILDSTDEALWSRAKVILGNAE